jgi:phosphoserine aminotransferase
MSSDILSRAVDVRQFGLIYAGAQKNIGPSGMALVIIRKDLAERAPAEVPVILRYSTHIKENSLYNTPNTWAVYLTKLTCDWLEAQGGVAAIQKVNERKAAALYLALSCSEGMPLCHERCLAFAERSPRG